MSDTKAILEANDAFYRALAGGDYSAMDEIWARRVATSCIHPGWRALAGREPVMASWRAILASPPPIRASEAQVSVVEGAAFVICLETIDTHILVATNIFVAEEGSWKMVHHHAGHAPEPAPGAPAPGTVH